jgi:hypothetical protein
MSKEPYIPLLEYKLISTHRRLTFDIYSQSDKWIGTEEMPKRFMAENGVEIISQSQMDIQTDRLWILGERGITRSGSMVFSSDEKRDAMFKRFQAAITEWSNHLREDASEFFQEPGWTPYRGGTYYV